LAGAEEEDVRGVDAWFFHAQAGADHAGVPTMVIDAIRVSCGYRPSPPGASASDRRRAAANEHTMIVDAIRAGDTIRARTLAEDHVRRDMNRLIDLRMPMESPPPGSPPGIEGIESAVSAVESFAVSLEGTAAASIRTVEEAVQTDLDRSKSGRLDQSVNVYDVCQNLPKAVPALCGTGFAADPSFFGEPGVIWCNIP
jgi:hypothetical protein